MGDVQRETLLWPWHVAALHAGRDKTSLLGSKWLCLVLRVPFFGLFERDTRRKQPGFVFWGSLVKDTPKCVTSSSLEGCGTEAYGIQVKGDMPHEECQRSRPQSDV